MKRLLISGGAGFIGSHVVRRFVSQYSDYQVFNLDLLTYAGNLDNVEDLLAFNNYKFINGDITDYEFVNSLFSVYDFTHIIHLAAESHVDRSIIDPFSFAKTNVMGTLSLLQAAKEHWEEEYKVKLFYHVSTDEVYGSLGEDGLFTEKTPYDPRSPYSASKASSDHFARAFFHTYNFPIKMSNCSNNYGSHHFPEKLIPLMIHNILNNKALPIYGKGDNIRDWLWVEDHASAIDAIFHRGRIGESYNVGGLNEWTNIKLVKFLCQLMDKKLNRISGSSEKLISFVGDRAGHDKRYAIDASKLERELGWKPSITFEEGLENTVDWYLENQDWVKNVTSGEYQEYYQKMYTER